MKLISYQAGERRSFGVQTDVGIIDVPANWPDGPRTVLEALQAGPQTMDRLRELAATWCHPQAPPSLGVMTPGTPKPNDGLGVAPKPVAIPLESVKLLAPIPAPPKVIGLAVNYVEHHKEWDRGYDLPDNPKYRTTPRPFLMPATCVIGPGETIPYPCYSKQIDYEIELAVVMGARASRVTPQQARQRIAGYTIVNDVSARSVTYAEGREKRPKDDFFDWLHGKWADGFCPLGPCLVTADEIGDPMNLNLELTVNGQVRQKARTSAMIFDVYEVVSFISHIMTLVPGDVIATGTPSGVAMATGNFLKGGDVIACRIEKIGELINTLGAEPSDYYTPCQRNSR